MNQPVIFPAQGQPIWELMQELEALGGVRHQDFKVTAGLERTGYQVTPELYQKWLEAGGVDTTGEYSNPSPEPEALAATGESDGADTAATPEDGGAVKADTEAPAQEEPKAAKAPAAKAATTPRGARK